MTAALYTKAHTHILVAGSSCIHKSVGRSISSSVQYHTCRTRRQLWSLQTGPQGPGRTSPSVVTRSGNGKTEPAIKDSDLAFVAKLVVASFAGAFLIKYGSLLVPLPFEPNAAVALAVVLGTPAVYSLYLLTQKQ